MPGFNQTGPMGQGSMTGRRMGKCTNFGANKKTQTYAENEESKLTTNENEESKQTTTENEELNKNNPDNLAGRGLGFGRGRGGIGHGMGQQNRFRGGYF